MTPPDTGHDLNLSKLYVPVIYQTLFYLGPRNVYYYIYLYMSFVFLVVMVEADKQSNSNCNMQCPTSVLFMCVFFCDRGACHVLR